jgi:Spy/CpxP family protein refolding chaperone
MWVNYQKFLLALVGVSFFGGLLLAAPGRAGQGHHGGSCMMDSGDALMGMMIGRDPEQLEEHAKHHLGKVLGELAATADQRDRAQRIAARVLPELRRTLQEKKALKEEAVKLWKEENPDAGRLHALVDRELELKREFQHRMVDAKIELFALLTPEQRQKLAQLHEGKMKHGKMHGKKGGQQGR